MDTARTVIRWAIPGSIFLGLLVLFSLLTALVTDTLPLIVLAPYVALLPSSITFALALVIPLGFLLEYIGGMLTIPIWIGSIVYPESGVVFLLALPASVHRELRASLGNEPVMGENILTSTFFSKWGFYRLAKELRTLTGRRRYAFVHRHVWDILSTLVNILRNKTALTNLQEEWTERADQYATLKTIERAVLLAYALASLTLLWETASHMRLALAFMVTTLNALILHRLVKRAQIHAWERCHTVISQALHEAGMEQTNPDQTT